MIIQIDQITESPKKIRFAEPIGELNSSDDLTIDFRFPKMIDVDMAYYRSGRDLFFHGWFGGRMEGHCSRCLKSYSFALEKKFLFVLTPNPFSAKTKELNRDELGLSYYVSKEINLFPFIREQVLLALPTRPLCEEACRGICPGCGADLNQEPCLCAVTRGDPRTAIFRTLKLHQ